MSCAPACINIECCQLVHWHWSFNTGYRGTSLYAFLELGNEVDSLSRQGVLQRDLESPCLLQQEEFPVFLLAELSLLIIDEWRSDVLKYHVKVPFMQPVDGQVVHCHQRLQSLSANWCVHGLGNI